MRRSTSYELIPWPDDRIEFSETPKEFLHQLEALNEAIAEAEDICAEFAIEIQREAHPGHRNPERISKEVGD
jgi:hypothetical protein